MLRGASVRSTCKRIAWAIAWDEARREKLKDRRKAIEKQRGKANRTKRTKTSRANQNEKAIGKEAADAREEN